jgi:hypothetical protein
VDEVRGGSVIGLLYFSALFALAQRAFCAAAICARPAALIVRLPFPTPLRRSIEFALVPVSIAFASWSRVISASIAATISVVSMSQLYLLSPRLPIHSDSNYAQVSHDERRECRNARALIETVSGAAMKHSPAADFATLRSMLRGESLSGIGSQNCFAPIPHNFT